MLRNKLPSSFNALTDLISKIKEKYIDQCNKNREIPNQERLDTLDYQVSMIILIEQVSNDYPLFKNDFIEAAWGVFLSGYVNIATSYEGKFSMFGPEKAYGYFFNSGSDVYTIYLETLAEIGIDDSQLSEQSRLDKLYYLLKYNDLIFNNFKNNFKTLFESKLTTTDKQEKIYKKAEKQTFASIQFIFKQLVPNTTQLMKAIPVESVIDEEMKKIFERYLQQSRTRDRKLLACIVSTIANIEFDISDEQTNFLNYSQRIKMGFLIYAIESLANAGNSALCRLCKQALNIDKIEDIDRETRLASLAACHQFLLDGRYIQKLETEYMKLVDQIENYKLASTMPKYINSTIIEHAEKISTMIKKISGNQPTNNLMDVAKGAIGLTALLGTIPGYFLGGIAGQIYYSDQQQSRFPFAPPKPKNLFSIVFDGAGGYLGYYIGNKAINFAIDKSLQQVYIQAFEALGALVGAVGGAGLVGVPIALGGLTYLTLNEIGKLYMSLHAQYSSTLAKDIDPGLMKCFPLIPDKIFSQQEKVNIKHITQDGAGIFKSVDASTAKLIINQRSEENKDLPRPPL